MSFRCLVFLYIYILQTDDFDSEKATNRIHLTSHNLRWSCKMSVSNHLQQRAFESILLGKKEREEYVGQLLMAATSDTSNLWKFVLAHSFRDLGPQSAGCRSKKHIMAEEEEKLLTVEESYSPHGIWEAESRIPEKKRPETTYSLQDYTS